MQQSVTRFLGERSSSKPISYTWSFSHLGGVLISRRVKLFKNKGVTLSNTDGGGMMLDKEKWQSTFVKPTKLNEVVVSCVKKYLFPNNYLYIGSQSVIVLERKWEGFQWWSNGHVCLLKLVERITSYGKKCAKK